MKKFIINLLIKKNKIVIILKVNKEKLTTAFFPNTHQILKKQIPSIFKNKCYNPDGNSFEDEIKSTETAHLFEHLLIENMCIIKTKYEKNALYSGRTFWDENSDNYIFKIEVKCKLFDLPIFMKAFGKSIFLMDEIFESKIKNQAEGSIF